MRCHRPYIRVVVFNRTQYSSIATALRVLVVIVETVVFAAAALLTFT